MKPQTPQALSIWRFTDGKPGHEKQTLGLCMALARESGTTLLDIPAPRGGWKNLCYWTTGRFPVGRGLPPPDLLVGAGHATHLPMLAARRAFGGRIVVLMRPSLPLALFDLCLVPEHDAPPWRANVIPTLGALNNVMPGEQHDPKRGLILVGGPSSHFAWDSLDIARQIAELVSARADRDWLLTTSRRTPADFLDGLNSDKVKVLPVQETPPNWVEEQLAHAGEVWVTPDSVSMVYEALTAGCRVGLFDLPARTGSRVAKGVKDLHAKGYVSQFPDQKAPGGPGQAAVRLNEAGRCAKMILEKWFP